MPSPLRSAVVGCRRLAGRLVRGFLGTIARAEHGVESGSVAITYDDGPHPVFTPRLLDLLAENRTTATFFVVGEHAHAHPAVIRRMIDEGHSVGTHTMHHPDLRAISRSQARQEIDRGRQVVEEIVGGAVSLFRPPNGHLTLGSALLLRSRRWRTRLWTTDSHDWKDGMSADAIAARALQVEDGGIVLLHDASQASLDATRSLVASLRERNVRLVGL